MSWKLDVLIRYASSFLDLLDEANSDLFLAIPSRIDKF